MKTKFILLAIVIFMWLIVYATFARAEDVVQIPKQEFTQFLGTYEKDQKICNLRSKQIKDLKQLTFMQAEQIRTMEEIEKSRAELAQIDDEYRRSLEARNEELKDRAQRDMYWKIGEGVVILLLLIFK